MNKDIIRAKCDRNENAIGQTVDFELLSHFTSDLLTAYSGVISEIMVRIIQEVLSDDESDDFD